MAEVRWDAKSYVHEESIDAVEDSSADESLYREFGRRLAAEGFTRSERQTPPGYPAHAGTVVYRYSSPTAEDSEAVVFQIGPGVMGVNAIPPYKTWEHFRPMVILGLKTLIASWQSREPAKRFSRVLLRYIDAFGEGFLRGRERSDFLEEVLGFQLSLPQAYLRHINDDATTRNTFVQFSADLLDGGRLSVRAGDATVENENAVVLDTTIAYNDGAPIDEFGVLDLLDSAHAVIHDTFVQTTKDVEHVLRGES